MTALRYSIIDRLLIAVDNGIRTVFASPQAQRPNPGETVLDNVMSATAQKKSAALMRINHSGEVCAQALYYGQAVASRSKATKTALLNAAQEETDHLAWCQSRIEQLHDHTSYLNPLWYVGSFCIGIVTGMVGDRWSLGFVVETERQVERHLRQHLQLLPIQDEKSQAILTQMCVDEAHHATVAGAAGAMELPNTVKTVMKVCSKIMTSTTYYI